MPVDPYIARGLPPLGNDLVSIAEMIQRQKEVNQRTQYQGQEMDLRNRQFGLDQADYNRRVQQQDAAVASEHAKETARTLLPLVKRGDQGAINKVLEGIRQHNPEMADTLAQYPELIVPTLENVIIGGPGPISSQTLPGGAQVITQDGEIKGSPHWPGEGQQQYAPELERRIQTTPDGRQQEYTFDKRSGKKSNFSQPYTPPVKPSYDPLNQGFAYPPSGPNQPGRFVPNAQPAPLRPAQAGVAPGPQPMYATSKSGRPMVSVDGGQTWQYVP
jgi:hypothetical protein